MNRSGSTLHELLLVITLLAILAGFAAPQARHALDVLNARNAREAVFGAVTQARALALARGAADLIIDPDRQSVIVQDAVGAVATETSLAPYRARIDTGAGRIALRYDARGLGRMSSRTIRISRGSVQTGVTISSYGRVRRW